MKFSSWLVGLAVGTAALAAAACGGGPSPTPTATTTAPGTSPTPASSTATATPSGPLTNLRVALDWFPWANQSGLYVAQSKGYFQQQGLKVDLYTPNDPSTVLETVGAGQDDFGLSYQPEVMLARDKGVPVVSIAAIVQHPLNSIMTLQSSGLKRPSDLKGKKVGTDGIPTTNALLKTMLNDDGLTMNDIQLVNVGYDLVPALLSGKVDAVVGAYWVSEGINATQQGHPVDVMKVQDWGVPDYYEIVVVASENTVKNKPQEVQAFVNAMSKGYQYAEADPQSAIDILAQASADVNQKLERASIQQLVPLWKPSGGKPFGWQTSQSWTTFSDWMKQHGLISSGVDPNAAFDNRFVAATGQ